MTNVLPGVVRKSESMLVEQEGPQYCQSEQRCVVVLVVTKVRGEILYLS